MGTLLISKIREEYPDRMMMTFSVVPSPKVCSWAGGGAVHSCASRWRHAQHAGLQKCGARHRDA